MLQQTQIEAEHRRGEERRVNTFIFIERLTIRFIGLAGVVGGVVAIIYGYSLIGGAMASLAIAGLAVFLKGNKT